MKKFISLFAALCICLSFMTSCSATETIQAEENIETTIILQINNPIMTVNGQDMEIDPGRGTVPLIQNDRTLVPVRAIVEAMGGSVNWDEETQTALLELNGDIITMTLGSQTAYFNETANTLDVVPVSINDRTMLPIRFIAERFNFDVNWYDDTQTIEITTITDNSEPARLLYQGQGSIRIVTGENKVIYIDPYSGSGYDLPADLILITHAHSDHNQIDLIEQRNEDCRIITQNEALVNGVHQKFEWGYVTVEAVEAGNNPTHDINECVGYVLTLSDGVSIYVSGDTSTTEQMAELAEKEIDYAFFCCDGHFNMDTEEASKCADLVKAKYSIPYHTKTSPLDSNFDIEKAEMFEAENRLIIDMGEEILLQPNESTLQTQETTSNTESQLTKETFSAENGTTLPYWLYTPQNAAPGMPMIVYLHGGSVKGNNLDMLMENDGLPKYLKESKLSNISAYIVMPQTTASRWSDIKDVMYNFVSTMAKTYEIDTSRISLTGHSMGGNGTWDLAAAFPDVFSSIAPLSGAVIASQDIIEALSDVSVWTFVGSEDTIVEAEYTEQFMEQLSTVNESAKLTVLEGIDHFGVPSVAYLDESYSLIDWLIQ